MDTQSCGTIVWYREEDIILDIASIAVDVFDLGIDGLRPIATRECPWIASGIADPSCSISGDRRVTESHLVHIALTRYIQCDAGRCGYRGITIYREDTRHLTDEEVGEVMCLEDYIVSKARLSDRSPCME